VLYGWLYGFWLCHKPVFYAEHRRLVAPCSNPPATPEGLVLYGMGRAHTTNHNQPYKTGCWLYGLCPYHIRPTSLLCRAYKTNQSSMQSIEDQPFRVAGGLINPILRLVFYAKHRRLGVPFFKQGGCI
jgi:hypothetical protein